MDSVVRVMAMVIETTEGRLTAYIPYKEDPGEDLTLALDGTCLFGQDVNAVVAEENSGKKTTIKTTVNTIASIGTFPQSMTRVITAMS